MVDIQTVSIAIASASIVVAVVYYILQIQHQKKVRETDLIMRTRPLFSMSYREWREYVLNLHLNTLDFKDYDDFVRKYGSFTSGKPEPETVVMLLSYFEMLGILLKRKLLSIDIVYDFYGMYNAWFEKLLMPLIEGFRKEWNVREFVNCEYLFNEMKKRSQKLQQKGVRNG